MKKTVSPSAASNLPRDDSHAPGILTYQANLPLNKCPGFTTSAQLQSSTLGALFIGLREHALEIYTGDDRQFIYDLEGRPIRFSTPNEYRFRGVSNRGTVVRKYPRGSSATSMQRELLSTESLTESCHAAWTTGVEARRALSEKNQFPWVYPNIDVARKRLVPILKKVEAFSPARLTEEDLHFSRIYQPVPVLPPDHYASLVLQATKGCSFNTCTFCTLYQGIPFRIRSVEAFEQHVRDALRFHGEGLRRFTQIFLGQANALAIPQSRLVRLLQVLRTLVDLPTGNELARPSWAHGHTSRFTGIGSFLDGFTGLNKSSADYAELRALGLTRVYLGVESGSPEILRWLRKPATPEEMLETIQRVKGAGLPADVILLVGAGGLERAREQIDSSITFLQRSQLRSGDRVFLSEIVEHPKAPYTDQMEAERLSRLTRSQLASQRKELSTAIRRLGLQPVPYRIEPFTY